jgi:hypothetical protein
MSATQPIPEVTQRPEAIDSWGKVRDLVARSQDLARFHPEWRSSPVSGIGAKFTGLPTTALRRKLLNSEEVLNSVAALTAVRPIGFQLSHPNTLSLITTGGSSPIPLSDSSKRLASELLNRMTMPLGSNHHQIRSSWPFRSVMLPMTDNSPIT